LVELTVALLLCAARHIPYMDASIRAGGQERPLGTEMRGKTLGVIGAGRIGKAVIQRISGFAMDILCYDILRDEAFSARYGARYTDLDTLLRESDLLPFIPH
jgi:D-3-phosphoglycerate dehydrogenase